jgi:hypothetical protein
MISGGNNAPSKGYEMERSPGSDKKKVLNDMDRKEMSASSAMKPKMFRGETALVLEGAFSLCGCRSEGGVPFEDCFFFPV